MNNFFHYQSLSFCKLLVCGGQCAVLPLCDFGSSSIYFSRISVFTNIWIFSLLYSDCICFLERHMQVYVFSNIVIYWYVIVGMTAQHLQRWLVRALFHNVSTVFQNDSRRFLKIFAVVILRGFISISFVSHINIEFFPRFSASLFFF